MYTKGPDARENRCLRRGFAPVAQTGGCNGAGLTAQSRQFILHNINTAKQIAVPIPKPVASAENGLVIKAPRSNADL